MSKRAQSGSNAAALVAIIAGLIILYILFLPPEVRNDLLEGNESNIWWDDNGGVVERTVLEENPGKLEYLKTDTFEHDIPSLYLLTKTDAKVLHEFPNVYVARTSFTHNDKSLPFPLREQADNMLLSFSAEGQGRLIITLNGQELFNEEVINAPAPIQIPPEYLGDDNTLNFAVSDVGWTFWRRHEYNVEDIKLTGDVTDTSAQRSTNTFWLSEEEYENIDYIKLKYFPDCAQSQAKGLTISINGITMFSGIPDCGITNTIEFSPDITKSGINDLTFRTGGGDYLVDSIRIDTELKEPIYPTYYFDLSQDEIDDIEVNLYDINLTVDFVDDIDFKKGKIIINGRTTHFQTYESTYVRTLNEYVEEGSNALEIIPDNTVLNIRELRLELIKVD